MAWGDFSDLLSWCVCASTWDKRGVRGRAGPFWALLFVRWDPCMSGQGYLQKLAIDPVAIRRREAPYAGAIAVSCIHWAQSKSWRKGAGSHCYDCGSCRKLAPQARSYAYSRSHIQSQLLHPSLYSPLPSCGCPSTSWNLLLLRAVRVAVRSYTRPVLNHWESCELMMFVSLIV